MIIYNLSNFKNRLMYLNFLKIIIKKEFNLFSRQLKSIIDIYGEDEILNAIDSIHLAGKYVAMPTGGIQGQILRALEYGTNNTKAYNIISQSVLKFEKEVNINGK